MMGQACWSGQVQHKKIGPLAALLPYVPVIGQQLPSDAG